MRKGSKDAVQHGTKIDRKLADYIAMGMKEWAFQRSNSLYALVSTITGNC
jgi:glutamine synthetase